MGWVLFVIVLCGVSPCTAKYYSQYGQDRLINERFIKNRKNGFFVDIGAHDGKTFSNTAFFREKLDWNGICFEPLSKPFKKLSALRPGTICLNACVSSVSGSVDFIEVEGYSEMLSGIVNTYHPLHLERLKREIIEYGGTYQLVTVPSVRFDDVMMTYSVEKIDLLSIDTEGSELEILKSINFDTVAIDIIAVENNYQIKEIRTLLESKGYRFIIHQGDEIYVRNTMGSEKKDPYGELKELLPLDMHGWFCPVNQKYLKNFIENNKPKVVVEVGVWVGKSAIFMAQLLDKGACLYAVDHWKGQYYWKNPEADIINRMPHLYEQFLSNVIRMHLTHVIRPVKMPSLQAAKELAIQVDLVYIDASHMADDVYNDIMAWHSKLKVGGVICGDDWISKEVQCGVKRAANRLGRTINYDTNFWFFE